MKSRFSKFIGKVAFVSTVTLTVLSAALVVKASQQGLFVSDAIMASQVAKFGLLAPLTFTGYNFVQVVVPVLPSEHVLPAGYMAFGWFRASWLSYLPIVAGSLVNFQLSRRFGWKVVEAVTSEKVVTWGAAAVIAMINNLSIWILFCSLQAILAVNIITLILVAWIAIRQQYQKQSAGGYQQARRWFASLDSKQTISDWLPSLKVLDRIRSRWGDRSLTLEGLIWVTAIVPLIFPIDILCYVYGLTKLPSRRFAKIIILAKLINVPLYGIVSSETIKWGIRIANSLF